VDTGSASASFGATVALQIRKESPSREFSGRPDDELVRQCLDGDRDAFETLVLRHQKGLVNHLFHLTGRKEVSLDLAQEVFIKVYQSLGSFDPRYRFTTWLYRIASNRAIDHFRKRRPHTFSLTQDQEGDGRKTTERSLRGNGPSPHEILRYREIRAKFDEAVTALPAEYRQLILLRHQRQCRYDEIARITNLPIGTVKNRIFRAREFLRRRLSPVLDAEG
jgi:RNA polymerase sigma-70 factor (ECF subfamily)